MPDLLWEEVKNFFDPDLMGTLPDVFVPGATTEDWQSIFDLIRTRGWQRQYSQGPTVLPLPSAAEVLARPADTEPATLKVWPTPGVLAIFWLMSADEIDFDVDLRELQGQEGVDILCDFLREIGRELGKPVLMTPEGGNQTHPILGFDPILGRVVALAERGQTHRSAEHKRPPSLTNQIPHNDVVDVSFDGAGAVGQGEAGGDGVLAATQAGDEGGSDPVPLENSVSCRDLGFRGGISYVAGSIAGCCCHCCIG